MRPACQEIRLLAACADKRSTDIDRLVRRGHRGGKITHPVTQRRPRFGGLIPTSDVIDAQQSRVREYTYGDQIVAVPRQTRDRPIETIAHHLPIAAYPE